MKKLLNLPDKFLSTPSGWRATAVKRTFYKGIYISIHALRVEGDPRCGALKVPPL